MGVCSLRGSTKIFNSLQPETVRCKKAQLKSPVKSGITNYVGFFYLKGAKEADLNFSSTPAISDDPLSDMNCRASSGVIFQVSDIYSYSILSHALLQWTVEGQRVRTGL